MKPPTMGPAEEGKLVNARGRAHGSGGHTEDRTHEGSIGEDGKCINTFHGRPEIRDRATSARQRSRTKETGEETKDQLRANIGSQGRA